MGHLIKRIRLSFKTNQKGFTLVELLVVIVIISILAGVIASSAAATLRSGRDGQRKSDLKKIQQALQQYYSDWGYFPSSLSPLALGIPGGPQSRSMWLDFVAPTGLNNCNGVGDGVQAPGACVVSRVYLSAFPIDPLDKYSSSVPGNNHYCYQAYSSLAEFNAIGGTPPGSSTATSACNNRTSATACHYYRLYGELENPTGTTFHCNDGTVDHIRNYSDSPT